LSPPANRSDDASGSGRRANVFATSGGAARPLIADAAAASLVAEAEMHQMAPDANDNEHRYRRSLRELQIELVKFQRDLIKRGARILIIIEGRDAAGKDGVIKHIVEHLSPRETRVVALPAPSSREQKS
jgi:polyphosphate kinase